MSGPYPAPQLIEPKRHLDERGWFVESYSERDAAARGITDRFVQDNHSLSRPAFTLRGLHFQVEPHAQSKLVRCIRGRIWDVIVDIRPGSPERGRSRGWQLSAENGQQLYIPAGFAHGFLTLEPDCEIVYKVSAPYSGAHDRGIRWDDPALGIEWPLPTGATPLVSSKDAEAPTLAEFDRQEASR